MKRAILLAITLILSVHADQNLEKIFGEIPALKSEDVTKINDWLLQEKKLITSLVMQDGALIDYATLHEQNKALLSEKSIVNYGKTNYVFACPVLPQYMIKISGPLNRLVNMVAADNKSPQSITDDEIKTLKRVVTYQTISSLPTYYLYLRLTKTMPLKYVYIPQTYLLRLPGAVDVLADTNYIIVQERIDLLEKTATEDLIKKLNDEQIKELVAVIASCGLWDIKGKIQIAKNGRIVIVDLEQPNISSPLKGFNIQEKDRFYNNARCGIDALIDMFEEKADLINKMRDTLLD